MTQEMRKQVDVLGERFPYIVKWERLMGASAYYVHMQLIKARDQGAPENAINRKDDGTWSTTDDITSKSTRRAMGLPPLLKEQVKPLYVSIHFNDGTEQIWRDINPQTAETLMARLFGTPTHTVDV